MIKIFVDSGSSIKQDEKEKLGIEILPLKINLDGTEYTDGIDLPLDKFYDKLINDKIFPRTSLPSLGEAEDNINSWLDKGYEVLIITISSRISGTYNALKTLFEDDSRVRVVDSKSAVGGVRLLVLEANKYLDRSMDFICNKLYALVPKIKVIAVPETLEYLCRGGRLSRTSYMVGSLLNIKPLITLDSTDGEVKVLKKVRGIRNAVHDVANSLIEYNCDPDYPIIPSYTYDKENVNDLIASTDGRFIPQMTEYDHLDPAIACHWGQNAFGYVFIAKAAD